MSEVGAPDAPAAGTTGREEEQVGRLLGMVDRALSDQDDRARERVAELRRKHPHDSPGDIIDRLTTSYVRRSARSGGAVGAVAAVPAVGTVTAALLTGGQTAAFLAISARYVLAVAAVHGIEVQDPARRRTLLLAALLGKDGAAAVQGELGLGTLAWGRAALTRLPLGTVRSVNSTLGRRLVRAGLGRLGGLALGRLLPFGVGAVVGWTGGRAVGRRVVAGARTSFGPAPESFA